MQKIKILTDSTCDIPVDKQKEYGIDIMNFTVIVDGEEYRERQDFTSTEFYEMVEKSKELPKTSQLTTAEILEKYKELEAQGWTDIIYVTICSTGSATYNNALNAAAQFEEHPSNTKIHVVDSLGYSGMYGYAVMQAALMSQKGSTAQEIVDYLKEWTPRYEAHFVPLSLKYVKKSGRITAAAAFAGELLGLRPLIKLTGGGSFVTQKIRGEKNIIPKIIEDAKQNMQPHTPYLIIVGNNREISEQLEKEMIKEFGYPAEYYNEIGATVTCNTGPGMVGLIFRRKDEE